MWSEALQLKDLTETVTPHLVPIEPYNFAFSTLDQFTKKKNSGLADEYSLMIN